MDIKLFYDRGTIVLETNTPLSVPYFFKFDERIGKFRALAIYYPQALRYFSSKGYKVVDKVLDLVRGSLYSRLKLRLRNYQKEALNRWLERGSRGVVVLPTGAGKTIVALAAIEYYKCPTLIIVPTLDLMDQWEVKIREYFRTTIGRYGGGRHDIGFITISTYDSAYINAEILGNKFKLLVFDEVHHLPSSGYRQIAELSAAPYRLGLTATPEREDGLHEDLPYLTGTVVYRRFTKDLSGKYLADFDIVTIRVRLTKEERKKYRELVDSYNRCFEKYGIKLKTIRDFEKLVMKSAINRELREALLAWHEARRIAFNARGKIEVLRELLRKHRGDKIIIFTEDNEMVRRISEEFLVPEITHKTDSEERKLILRGFKNGDFKVIVTSRVLEEGVDVPDANVAIVLSGTGSRRQYIQRLGRVLRPKRGKAILYELVTSGTKEIKISKRRKRELGEDSVTDKPANSKN